MCPTSIMGRNRDLSTPAGGPLHPRHLVFWEAPTPLRGFPPRIAVFQTTPALRTSHVIRVNCRLKNTMFAIARNTCARES